MNEESKRKLELEGRLRGALARDELSVLYQPLRQEEKLVYQMRVEGPLKLLVTLLVGGVAVGDHHASFRQSRYADSSAATKLNQRTMKHTESVRS